MQRSTTLALMLALCAGSALAADNGKINTLGNASAKAPIMSRDELRACLKQKDDLKVQADTAKSKRAQLDDERKQLELDQATLSKDHELLVAKVQQLTADFNAKVTEQSKVVEAFNSKMEALNAAEEKGENVDRQRMKLEKEGKAVQQSSADLATQKDVLNKQISDEKAAFDAKNAGMQARIDDWNKRNHSMETVADQYEQDLDLWKTQCGGRNYRESDEKVIRSGG